MAFTVTDFKSNLFAAAAAGGARPSLYKISITDSSSEFTFSDTENIFKQFKFFKFQRLNL